MVDLVVREGEYLPSTDAGMAALLSTGLGETLRAAARNSLELYYQENPDVVFTERQERAVLLIEELKLVNGVDLAALLHRWRLIQEIEMSNAFLDHPGDYEDLDDMLRQEGISAAEISKIRTLMGVVVPWIEENLHVSLAEWWEQAGKSRIFELLPVMKALILGEIPSRGSVAEMVANLQNDAWATVLSQDPDADRENPETIATVNANILENLVEQAGNLPVQELRRRLRPNGRPPLEGVVLNRGERRAIVIEINDDAEWELFNRVMERHTLLHALQLPRNRADRELALRTTPGVRDIFEALYE